MKEIKSNPSKILDCYIIPSRDDITVRSVAEEKQVKLTEIAMMDRHSNGSFIVKDRLLDTYQVVKLIGSEELKGEPVEQVVSEVKEEQISLKLDKEMKSLKNIDEKMMSIDEYLNDIEDK